MYMNKITKTDHTTETQIASFHSPNGITEYHVLLRQTDCTEDFHTQQACLQKAYSRLLEELPGNPTAIFKRYFLSDVTNQATDVMEQEHFAPFCALSIVQQAPMNGTKIALWVWLQTGVQTQVHPNGMLEANHNGYRQLLSTNLCNRATNSEYQTRLIFRDYIMQLMNAGCTLAANCLRTWLFVQNVDVNYAGVVKARQEVFTTQGLTEETHFIASTGIEGRYFDPMVFVTMDAYAVAGIVSEQVRYLYASENLNRTYEYGVTFERGTAITYGDRRHIFISGTASIDKYGEIVYPGDILRQAERMMENVTALLREANATMDDVMQAVVYLRDTADYVNVKHYLETHFPSLPHVIVRASVCRTGWLIEMDCLAMTGEGDERFRAL